MRWEIDWLHNRARLTPNKEAIIHAENGHSWTYKQLNDRANHLKNWLVHKGVKKGDRVALLAPNHISYFDFLTACSKLGAIFVPLNWRLAIEEINYILEDCTPVLLGYHTDLVNIVKELSFLNKTICVNDSHFEKIVSSAEDVNDSVHGEEHDPLALIYTGGTTGKPKGAVLSHRSIIWNGINTIVSWNLTERDTTLTYMPMFHTGGLNALSIPLLMTGGKVVIADQFDPYKAMIYLNQYQCTIVLFVPTMYHLITQTEVFEQTNFPTVKAFLSGGAPCPYEIYAHFQRKGLAFKEGYGLTEAGPNNFYIDPVDAMRKKGSIGKPMMFNGIKLVNEHGGETSSNEVGELLIIGKHSFEYYWNNKEDTENTIRNGWIYTGDLARRDEEGYYYIVGRKKDMIISGGENIYPLEVEHWLSSHPKVNEAAVIGMPNDKWGEIVTAFIVQIDDENVTEEELKSYCEKKLGKYKIPKRFIFLEELPKTHVGKIDKNKLKKMGTVFSN
ncbi:long-chain fatty acid--CoA ligase [Bacillus aquiflavi]|uniref:Long-chain fatty acid--CoA ligase n=1 Tax=Bacillus aquiflavi TaxID=2672567 RepID=A0A6B3VY29_9BACI|nr:long-chain fatty acid--CoA ligase [Bacillus aquiflavi]MBA4537952.1 long-chain fatty acid--CoA ligase [Bacillus aquiflavi]NEY82208.1 long-chain fatty acid--CoA ligase [Bacillus aquiflavi]UAC49027.1 long-chain fatty acid--CoA ligase [Bacillus aquiflavi]